MTAAESEFIPVLAAMSDDELTDHLGWVQYSVDYDRAPFYTVEYLHAVRAEYRSRML